MSASAPAEDRWRVIGKGNDATFRDCDDPSREEDEVRAARWIEHAAPESALSIERRGSSGFGDRVVTELTVCAQDAAAAEARARSLLAHALPAITFTEMIGRRDTVDRTLRYPADRVCSFCGKSQEQVRRLIAGHRGACICDECVGTAVETMDDAGPPPEPTSS